MPTTEGYNGTFTGPQIDEAIAKTKNAITASNGGELDMAESLGDGPYVIEFTEETSSGGSGGMTEEEADARYADGRGRYGRKRCDQSARAGK